MLICTRRRHRLRTSQLHCSYVCLGSSDGCTPFNSEATGGTGGGIIHIYATNRVEIDGSVVSDGDDSTGTMTSLFS